MDEFLAQIAEILDVPEVHATDAFTSFEAWDSLSQLSLIALLDSKYGVNFTANALKDYPTVGDLWNAIQARRKA